jgi:opacity protein-like surface antigen
MRGRAFLRGARLAIGSLCLGYATSGWAAQPAEPPAIDAQNPSGTQPSSAVEQPTPSDKWQFATIGYIWFAGAKGETDVIGPVPPVGLDLRFHDVLKGFKFGFMGAAEARRGRIVVLGDLMYVHLGTHAGIDIRDQDFLDADLHSRTGAITLLGGYRVAEKGPVTVDLLAGGRLNYFKTSLRLEGPNRIAEGSVKQTWLDPIIAARARAPLGGKWSLTLYGDVGGIIAGSDVDWQAIATVNYNVSRKITVGAGWRYFKVNYDKGDFLYDIGQSGPILMFRSAL